MPRDFVGDPDLGLFRREAHLRELVEPVLRRRVERVDGLGEPDVVQGFLPFPHGCLLYTSQDRMAAHAGQSYWQCPGHSDREKRL